MTIVSTEPVVIAKYRNGDYLVTLLKDGTKIRETLTAHQDSNELVVAAPESIDLKITDFCDAGCAWCHEKSTKRGVHADLSSIRQAIDGLPAGAEIALGGGNPLAHPQLPLILADIKERGLIANLTVNEFHFDNARTLLAEYQRCGWLYGVGVSLKNETMPRMWEQYEDAPMPKNLVYHLIAGINSPQAVINERLFLGRILVLGYKQFGFGLKFYKPQIEANLERWRYWIGTILQKVPHVSFDNLAIEQLGIRDLIKPQAWASQYMGDDGQFTMYVDAVKREYASSSTSRRWPMELLDIRKMFKKLKERQPFL